MAIAFRQSASDAPELPDDWEMKTLGEIGEALIGLTYDPSRTSSRGTLVLRSSNIQDDQLSLADNVFVQMPIPDRIRTRSGDILICVRNGSSSLIGKCLLLDEQTAGLTFGAFMAVLRTPESRYVFHQFRSGAIKRQISEGLGATINQITNANLKSFQIPYPRSKEERDAIAGVLDDFDQAILSTSDLISKKAALKTAVARELLTGRRRLSGFHDEWVSRSLGDIGVWRGGATPSMANASFWEGGDIPWLSSGDIKQPRLRDSSQHITAVALHDSAAVLLPAGAVVLVTRSGILRKFLPVAKLEKPMAINQDLKAVVCRSDVDADFVLQLLTMNGPRILMTCLKTGTTVESMEHPWVLTYSLPMPKDPTEQRAIATVLSDMDSEIEALEARLAKTRDLKTAVAQELLSGRTRLV
jgi:type I restriction enzyme S subunit